MKANKPSLILYFIACILAIYFRMLGDQTLVLYAKSFIIPSIFMYYFITNDYKINWIKSVIFLFCFIGGISNYLNFNDFGLVALFSFLLVYLLLTLLAVEDFRGLKFEKKDTFSILSISFFIVVIYMSIITIEFERLGINFSLFILYGIVLALLTFASLVNYMKKGNFMFFNLVLMCVCFIISDVFYVINKHYFSLDVFSFVNIVTHVFSGYFMVTYFIEKDKYNKKIGRK